MATFDASERATVWRSVTVRIDNDELKEIVDDYLEEDPDNEATDGACIDRLKDYIWSHEYDDYDCDTDDEDSDGFEYDDLESQIESFLDDEGYTKEDSEDKQRRIEALSDIGEFGNE